MARTPSTEDVYEGDGTTAVFQFHFPFLHDTDVFVSVDDVNVSFTILPGSTAQVQLTVPPAVGSIVKVYRSTLAYVPEHLFANGVPFLPRYVDENNRQLLYASQEAINDTAVTAAEALAVAEEAKEIAERAESKIDGAIFDSSYQLRLDLANSADFAKGPALIAYNNGLVYPAGTVGYQLNQLDSRFAAANAYTNAQISAYNQLAKPRGGNLATTIKAAIQNLGEVGRTGIYATALAGFNCRFGSIWFTKHGTGSATLISNLDKYKPAGAFATPDNYAALGLKAYFVSTSGSDAAAGTSWATALRTVAAATQKTDVDVIFVAGGKGANYFAAQHHGTYAGTRSIAIHAIGGRVRFISGPVANAAPTWNATGIAGVYKQGSTDASITGVVSLDYTDELGNPLTLLPAPDVNGVGAVPGSWFRSATELFISLPDGSQPSSNTYFYYSAPMRVTGGDKVFYARGIDYVGGNAGAFSARNGNGNTVIFMEDCGFCGQAAGDGFQIKNIGLAIAVRCKASHNANDGFNYHGPDGTTPYVDPHFLEYMCLGAFNRAVGTGNGSTAHELVRGIRINCHYCYNAGPGVADVNDAQTYNVAVTSRKNATYGFQASSDAATSIGVRMFLDGCVADGNPTADVNGQNGSAIFYRDLWAGDDVITLDGTSTTAPFTS